MQLLLEIIIYKKDIMNFKNRKYMYNAHSILEKSNALIHFIMLLELYTLF